jgi:hypothetical protein
VPEPIEPTPQSILNALVPTPPQNDIYRDVMRRVAAARRIRIAEAGGIAVLVAAAVATISLHLAGTSSSRTATIPGLPLTSPSSASASILGCGSVPTSDGELASKALVTVQGPARAASGSTLTAQVEVRAATQATLHVETITAVKFLITKGGVIVGGTFGPLVAAGEDFDVTPTTPYIMSSPLTVYGCPLAASSVSPPAVVQDPLVAGTYELVAVVQDDSNGEEHPANLVSKPLDFEVTPQLSGTGDVSSPATFGLGG